jgi:HEAT repeat protein
MGIYPELENLDLKDLIEYWHTTEPLDGEEYAASYYDELAFLIADKGTAGRLFLKEQISKTDDYKLASILVNLPSKEHPISSNTLFKYLKHESSPIIGSAIEGLIIQEEIKAKNEVLKLRFHESAYVRSSVLRFMSKLYPEEARSLLIKALQDRHEIVRQSAIDEIDELQMTNVIPTLRPFLNDSSPDVRQAAETAIENLEDYLSN